MRQGFVVFSLALLVSLVTLGSAPTADAQPAGNCAVPPGLGASLLFPHFEVDLDDVSGVSTVLSVNNGVSIGILTRVVLWTDWGVPSVAFDVWLEPFDVQTINVRSILDGNIPSTGATADLSTFPFCDAFPPNHTNPILLSDEIAQLRADHTGQLGPIFLDCGGEATGDNIARGYITVDVVDECSGVEGAGPFWTPASSDAYFDDGDGERVATNDNFIWGDYTFLDFAGNAAQGSQAVPIWADDSIFTGPDQYTFYGRFHGYDGRDHRVPLPFRFNQRFLNGGDFGGGADVIVWRDPEAVIVSSECGVTPAPYPLLDGSSILDEDGNIQTGGLDGMSFPLATQRTSISSLSPGIDFGLIQIDSEVGDARSQLWVETTLAAGALGFSASWPGAPVSFLCASTPSTSSVTPATKADPPSTRSVAPNARSTAPGAKR